MDKHRKQSVASAELDAIEAAYQWREQGIIDVEEKQADPTLAGPSGKVTRTGDTPWLLVDGIKWDQERVIFSPDGGAAVQIRLKAPRGVDGDLFANNRVLARFLPNGSIREILIDFTPPYLEEQDIAGTVFPEDCPKCKRAREALK